MAVEFLHCAWRYKEIPFHYFTRFAYRRHVKNYLDYVSNREIKRLHEHFNTGGPVPLLADKLYFQYFCERHGLPGPRMLGHITRRTAVQAGRATFVESPAALRAWMSRLAAEADSNVVFAKPTRGWSGMNVFRIDFAALPADDPSFAKLLDAAKLDTYLIQAAIVQHPDVAEVHPPSVNTIRLDTYVHDDGSVEIMSAIMRFGAEGRHVDNGTAGGLFVGIDLDTHTLRGHGYRLIQYGGAVCTHHPTTHVPFAGRHVPHLDAVQDLVRRAASLIPSLPLLGWDVAIQLDGPLLIEGNHDYHKGMQDIAFGGYRRHPTFRRLLDACT